MSNKCRIQYVIIFLLFDGWLFLQPWMRIVLFSPPFFWVSIILLSEDSGQEDIAWFHVFIYFFHFFQKTCIELK